MKPLDSKAMVRIIDAYTKDNNVYLVTDKPPDPKESRIAEENQTKLNTISADLDIISGVVSRILQQNVETQDKLGIIAEREAVGGPGITQDEAFETFKTVLEDFGVPSGITRILQEMKNLGQSIDESLGKPKF